MGKVSKDKFLQKTGKFSSEFTIRPSGLFQLEVALKTKFYIDTSQDSLDGGIRPSQGLNLHRITQTYTQKADIL
jgi:hypothetical protein